MEGEGREVSGAAAWHATSFTSVKFHHSAPDGLELRHKQVDAVILCRRGYVADAQRLPAADLDKERGV